MEIKFELFFDMLKKQKPANVYFFLAEEVYFKNKAVEFIKKKLMKNDFSISFNYTHFYGANSDVRDIINTANTLPVFSDKRLIVVDEFEKLKNIEKLNDYLSDAASFTCIIFNSIERKLPAKLKIKKDNIVVKFYALEGYKLKNWVINKLKIYNKNITSKASDKLIEYTDNSLVELSNELEKLVLFIGDNKEITEQDVMYITGDTKNYNVFTLSEVILSRDLRNSLKVFKRLFLSGVSVSEIFYMLSASFQKIWNIKYLRSINLQNKDIMSRLRINWFQFNKLSSNLHHYSLKKLEQSISIFYTYDKKLKSTSDIPKNILIEQLFVELCK